MRVLRSLWLCAFAVVTVVGAAATVASMSLLGTLITTLTMGVFGAALGYALGQDLPGRGLIQKGAVIFGWPVLVLPGLAPLLGPWLLAVIGGLIVTSPDAIRAAYRVLGRRRTASSELHHAAEADTEDALRLQWAASSAQLEGARTDRDRLLVIEVRSQILDDLTERYGAHLPDYVWTSLHGPGDNAGQPGAGQGR
ncbi:hypothetical protein [Nocardioides sp.]|uniref:hypothetical protein n=1 Tax=Nocardioides sp. TaxID=35761 RepID=UPI003D120FBB